MFSSGKVYAAIVFMFAIGLCLNVCAYPQLLAPKSSEHCHTEKPADEDSGTKKVCCGIEATKPNQNDLLAYDAVEIQAYDICPGESVNQYVLLRADSLNQNADPPRNAVLRN